MRQRGSLWVIAGALIVVGAVWVGYRAIPRKETTSVGVTRASGLAVQPSQTGAGTTEPPLLSEPSPVNFVEALAKAYAKQNRSRYPNRLSNTSLPLKQLQARDTAILLQNALLDTANGVSLNIPGQLHASDDPGTYIVQSKGPLDDAFRTQLKQSGAVIVSYIPNNAYLVWMSEGGADALRSAAQAVLRYEPYYKLSPMLLDLAVKQRPLP